MTQRPARLLPWTGSDGRSCYLITDDHGGPVSRLADDTEAIQLDMGARLLTHADALRDALRIAESRGNN
ncbi:hypothetical protein GCM10010145_01690 [Streptomyces ruber]|uniref:Uncharacterized protein n=2 Tax=Streptomyces TaxID=1883 RepID=A0A918EN28_9ACTN|nr:hypothetical protein [Streptomyces ruber]GGQ38105.1 hypothetical protein GCM10010145_01690 [Streptomyces ruber]